MDTQKINGRCSVLIAAFATGIICNKDLTFFQKEQAEKDLYQFFDNIEEAEEFADGLISNRPEIECWIHDAHGECILIIDKNGKRKPLPIRYPLKCLSAETYAHKEAGGDTSL